MNGERSLTINRLFRLVRRASSKVRRAQPPRPTRVKERKALVAKLKSKG